MSSNQPQVRRSTRALVGRPGGAADENASRLTRPLRSSKMATAASTRLANTNPPEKPAPVASSNSLLSARAELAAAKRKREALGEVTNKNKSKFGAGAAGGSKPGVVIQGSEKDTLIVKRPAPTTLNVASNAKVSITERTRVVASRKTRSSAATDKDEAPQDDHAMIVDNEQPAATRARRVSAPRTALNSTITARRAATSTSTSVHTSRRVNVPTASTTTATSRVRATGASHRVLGATQPRSNRQSSQPTEEDVKPVHKKRRTSSIGPENQGIDDGDEEAQFVVPEDEKIEEKVLPAPEEPELGLSSLEGESKWADLDREEEGDPNMVSEYAREIFHYLLDLELKTMPNPRYMDMQKELAWRMRGILTDWLIQIHSRFRLLPETLFLCINIIDRFLSARVVSLVKLQLVGVTSLFIAAKYEEIMAPSVANFLSSADGNYDEKDILEAEKYILRTLDWNLSYPNPIQFLRRASKADDYDLASRTVAKYLIEISCIDHRLLEAPPSLVAAAGMWLARLVLDKEEWTPALAHYSYYTEKEILPVARLMLNYILKPTRHDNFFKKYAGRKFMKASPFVHAWARDRWPEGSNVDLETELPELRRAAEERRLNGTAAVWLADEDGTPIVLQ